MEIAQPEVRIDKWLWAVRIFKTRTLATEACRAGHVTIAGVHAKPSRAVRVDEIISIRTAGITRTIKVLALLENRVGPKVAPGFAEDQTPAEEYLRLAQQKREQAARPIRPKGAGRPTKKDRRALEKIGMGGDGVPD